MSKLKILILSGEVWQDGTNGGNVLTNMFEGFPAEFAQVYCNPGMPQNNICKRYYQMTDGMVIRSFLRHKPIGKSFVLTDTNIEQKTDKCAVPEEKNKGFDKFFHKFNFHFFFYLRSLMWNLSNWKNDKLKKFIDDFSPDIIFAPCYGNVFKSKLTRFVAEYTGKKVISYISDDSYSLRQVNFSLFYWINRLNVRRALRKVFPCYSLVYTMTDIQKKQCEKHFNANVKILLKPVDVKEGLVKESVNTPIKIVYAGGIYLNRYKTLIKLKEAIERLNKGGIKAELHVYTANLVSKRINRKLNDNVNGYIHKAVSSEELFNIYAKSDIALHVESLDLKNRLAVRMSFSTKIMDCLSSGCACMAICDKRQGGFDYLNKNDLAICISKYEDIYKTLEKVAEDKNIILDYSKKALSFAKENHNATKIREEIKKDFISVLDNESLGN